MKRLFLTLIVLFSASSLFAGDVSYKASMSGIACEGCKKTIATSLSKIDGVKTIRISKESEGKHTMTVLTDGTKPISREEASKAIAKADHYKILSWAKVE